MTSNFCDIEKLVELFQFANKDSQLDDENDDTSNEPKTENNIQCASNENVPNQSKTVLSPYTKLEPRERKEILDPEADDVEELYFDETSKNANLKGWKKTPKWDISYRQSVTASDVFLGMGFKTPSTSSCENMVVTIELPQEKRQNIDLKIEKQTLTLSSPKFFLDLKLPHPVDPKRGNAQFDKDGEKLVVTLIMDRELDLLNF